MIKIIKSFFHSYFEIPQKKQKFVSLGGGTGLSTLLSGLKLYSEDITAIVTMADEGGSTGRLRRTFGVPAVGDLRNSLSALSQDEPIMQKILSYRFSGNRYGKDKELGGHNLGNLILVALSDIYGDFNKGLEKASQILNISGKVLPSTISNPKIWAETEDGKKVYGEEKIDLGLYNGKRSIKKLHLNPPNSKAFQQSLKAIKEANVITAGPGDLYTSIMPNLLVKDLRNAIVKSKARKILIVNIANKPFETPNYKVSQYISAIFVHCGQPIFDYILVNNNFKHQISKKIKYSYVEIDRQTLTKKFKGLKIIEADLVDPKNPLHHQPEKLAKAIFEML